MKTELAKVDKCLFAFKPAIKIGPTQKSEVKSMFMCNRICSIEDLTLKILSNRYFRFSCKYNITDSMDMSLSKLWEIGGQGNQVCCSTWGCKESDTSE